MKRVLVRKESETVEDPRAAGWQASALFVLVILLIGGVGIFKVHGLGACITYSVIVIAIIGYTIKKCFQ